MTIAEGIHHLPGHRGHFPLEGDNKEEMEQAREWLQQARRIAVLTGAGISADWLIAKAEPNPGHLALVHLEEIVESFALVTRNVDGLHARAGSSNIRHMHGDIWTLRCIACGLSYKNLQPRLEELPPRCSCGGMQRPGVVWFGEGLPEETWREADQAVRSSEVFLVIGTSAVVMPAGGLVYVAKQAGARVIEINAAETQVSPIVDCAVRGEAGKILPELLKG